MVYGVRLATVRWVLVGLRFRSLSWRPIDNEKINIQRIGDYRTRFFRNSRRNMIFVLEPRCRFPNDGRDA